MNHTTIETLPDPIGHARMLLQAGWRLEAIGYGGTYQLVDLTGASDYVCGVSKPVVNALKKDADLGLVPDAEHPTMYKATSVIDS